LNFLWFVVSSVLPPSKKEKILLLFFMLYGGRVVLSGNARVVMERVIGNSAARSGAVAVHPSASIAFPCDRCVVVARPPDGGSARGVCGDPWSQVRGRLDALLPLRPC
jgi:hypothetical protein